MLLILINTFMLITDDMATRKPIKYQILTLLVNRIDLFKLWK